MAEMIKDLMENQDAIYCVVGAKHLQASTCDGVLIFENKRTGTKFTPNIRSEWEKLKKPVTFMEAVKALDAGRTIYAMHGTDFKYKEVFSPKGNKPDWGYAVKQHQGYAVDTGLILYGKWYIED